MTCTAGLPWCESELSGDEPGQAGHESAVKDFGFFGGHHGARGESLRVSWFAWQEADGAIELPRAQIAFNGEGMSLTPEEIAELCAVLVDSAMELTVVRTAGVRVEVPEVTEQ